MHCSSLGEFEQGRPLFEKLRNLYPQHKFLLTFFSPSGYEIRKDYKGADWVFYLPLDGQGTARRFLEIVHPSLVIFVKYEFWYYYLKEMKSRDIPVLLVSAIFRKDAIFFKWYGQLQRKMLRCFTQLFVQNQASKELLTGLGLGEKTIVTGDTRFDRVIEIAEAGTDIPVIEQFLKGSLALVAGSSWPGDEKVLQESLEALQDDQLKLIIAPHEIHEDHIGQIQQLFPVNIRFSAANGTGFDPQKLSEAKVLIIDNIGMLSRLYRYARICYVGGGFGEDGVHNVLEAAVYGKPVMTGPVIEKYAEVVELAETGGVIIIDNALEAEAVFDRLLRNPEEYAFHGGAAKDYVYSRKGATEKILEYIQENRLLTS